MKYWNSIFEALGSALTEKDGEIIQLNWKIEDKDKEIMSLKRENEKLKGLIHQSENVNDSLVKKSRTDEL